MISLRENTNTLFVVDSGNWCALKCSGLDVSVAVCGSVCRTQCHCSSSVIRGATGCVHVLQNYTCCFSMETVTVGASAFKCMCERENVEEVKQSIYACW